MVVTTALVSMSVLLYLDLRIRTEGLDIELQAADAFARDALSRRCPGAPGRRATARGSGGRRRSCVALLGAVGRCRSVAGAAGAVADVGRVPSGRSADSLPVPDAGPGDQQPEGRRDPRPQRVPAGRARALRSGRRAGSSDGLGHAALGAVRRRGRLGAWPGSSWPPRSALVVAGRRPGRPHRAGRPDPTRDRRCRSRCDGRRSSGAARPRQFEARGEWKAALRCRYRALVADLVARKVVRDLAGRTTGRVPRRRGRGPARRRPPSSAARPSCSSGPGTATARPGPRRTRRFRELADRRGRPGRRARTPSRRSTRRPRRRARRRPAGSAESGRRPVRCRGRRSWLWALIVGGLVVVALVAGGPTAAGRPLDPASTDGNGTKALVDAARRVRGRRRRSATRRPTPSTDVAVLLSDSTSQDMTDELERWVDAGGTLVVADPRSSFARRRRPRTATLRRDRPSTSSAATARSTRWTAIDRSTAGRRRAATTSPEPAESCFARRPSGAFVVDTPTGDGHIVSVGSAGTFTNELLGSDDNAALAVALMAPREGTTVAVLYGMTPGRRPGARASASWCRPACAWRSLQLVVAFVLYAWWRGRRLGQPVREPQPVQIAGSELVGAVGNLHAADPRPRSGGPAAASRPAPPAGRAPRPAAAAPTPT